MLWWITIGLCAAGSDVSIEDRLLVRSEPPRTSAVQQPSPEWSVRRGSGPVLDTPQLLEALDQPDAWASYERLQRRDMAHGVGLAVGSGLALVAGVGAAMVGGTLVFDPELEWGGRRARIGVPLTVAGGATALVASGTVWLSAVPWSRRRAREQRPDTFLDVDEVDRYISQHNARLEAGGAPAVTIRTR